MFEEKTLVMMMWAKINVTDGKLSPLRPEAEPPKAELSFQFSEYSAATLPFKPSS